MMKLVLANNHTPKFVAFYDQLKQTSPTPFDYSPYNQLLFYFDAQAEKPIQVQNLATNLPLEAYDGIYINGYLASLELAVTVAICAEALDIPYVNQELSDAPSLSKLSAYAKLAAAKVAIPKTIAGTKKSLASAVVFIDNINFPAILKRADADRGIDNFKVKNFEEALSLLEDYEPDTIWILQEYLDNDGYYLVSFYDSEPSFCIFRSLEKRPDNNELKAHMYKPKGGVNAELIKLDEAPKTVIQTSQKAVAIMNRQIGSADCIYDANKDIAYILEVNYNPQLVTIETFKEVRIQAFLNNLKNIKKD